MGRTDNRSYRIRRAHLNDCPALAAIWEEAVTATHDFLAPEDFADYKSRLDEYFHEVKLFALEYTHGTIAGFAGIAGNKLEMLFVRERGKGIGKALVDFAVKERGVAKVDVNAQNKAAIGFYMKYGFRPVGTSPTDAEGKPYPIMHMEIAAAQTAGHPHMHGQGQCPHGRQ